MKMYRVPKAIAAHEAVASVVPGEDQGSDSKFWVFLKDGYQFTGGERKGCTGGSGIDSVADFKYANPQKIIDA
jgi:hypothetical protein